MCVCVWVGVGLCVCFITYICIHKYNYLLPHKPADDLQHLFCAVTYYREPVRVCVRSSVRARSRARVFVRIHLRS